MQRLTLYFYAMMCMLQHALYANDAAVSLSHEAQGPLAQEMKVDLPSNAPFLSIVDLQSNMQLGGRSEMQRMRPSSMTKILTTYIVFDLLKNGRLTEQTRFIVSARAANVEGSRMFLRVGQSVSVEDLLYGLIVVSGNDASIVLAEGISGSEESFSLQMNAYAKKLNLTHSHFENASGLPHENHYVTCADLIHLCKKLIKNFPESYVKYHTPLTFTFNNITQKNTNPLLHLGLGRGIKTGFTKVAGYGLVGEFFESNGRHILFVVNGLRSDKERAAESKKIVLWAQQNFQTKCIFQKNHKVLSLPHASRQMVAIGPKKDVFFSAPRMTWENARLTLKHPQELHGSLCAGQQVATLQIQEQDYVKNVPLYALETISSESWWLAPWFALMRWLFPQVPQYHQLTEA